MRFATSVTVAREPPRTTWNIAKADWVGFSRDIDNSCTPPPTPDNCTASLSKRVEDFNKAILAAARRCVGSKTIRRPVKIWMTRSILAGIRKRNELRRNIQRNRAAWCTQCGVVEEEIREAKGSLWREFLNSGTAQGKCWTVLRAIRKGGSAQKHRDVPLVRNGTTYTTDKGKANAFIQHYATISKLKHTKPDRTLGVSNNSALRVPKVENDELAQYTGAFNMDELLSAISSRGKSTAPGPDNIHPAFIDHLGPTALKHLLSLFNESIATSKVPQCWRDAEIIPILKRNKEPDSVTSYRPISLTSVLGKLLERLISNRLTHFLETKNLLSNTQSGFRGLHSTEDHILRLTQSIHDGYQAKPPLRTVL